MPWFPALSDTIPEPQGSAHLPKHSFQTPRPQTRSGKASSGSAASSPWTPASYCCEEPVGTQTSLPVLFSKAFYLNKRLSTEKPVGVFSSPLSSKQLGKEKRREKRDGFSSLRKYKMFCHEVACCGIDAPFCSSNLTPKALMCA